MKSKTIKKDQPKFMNIKKKDIRGKHKLNIDMRKLKGSRPIDPSQKEEWIKELKAIVEKYTDNTFKTYDYKGIAEEVIKMVEK